MLMQSTIYIKTIRSNKVRTSILELEELINRFQSDEKRRRTVEDFRNELKDLPPFVRSKQSANLPRICPGQVVRRRRNGTLSTTYTGVVLLEVGDLANTDEAERLKATAASWPTTIAAVVGASGKTLKILVRGTFDDGSLPTEALAIERFHRSLYDTCAAVYASVLGTGLKAKNANPTDTFLWTYDPTAHFDGQAAAVKVSRKVVGAISPHKGDDALEYGPQSNQPSPENHNLWRRRFALAVTTAREQLSKDIENAAPAEANEDETQTAIKKVGKEHDAEALTTELEIVAIEALRLGIPQEEAVRQAWQHLRWRSIGKTSVRTIIESAYLENSQQAGRNRDHSMQELTYRLQDFITTRYDLRFNILTNGVEWRSNNAASFVFQPLDARMMNTMIQECHESGLDVYDRDMKRFLGSTRIRDYHVARTYLRSVEGEWDGKTDYIGMLADRVPCRNPYWREWFHTWFLGMVAQWDGWDTVHGNSVVPLLIGQQGCGKSTFGQLILPPELREVGYRELVDFTSKQDAERLLTSALLINLDEFNQVSEKIQQGFLKNLIQKSSVKGRRPYSSVTQNLPRYASFIATTNMADVLSDPSGSRRFIVADIRDGFSIDTQPPYNYTHIYAQAIAEIEQGRRHYFTADEVQAIEQYNAGYNAMRPEISRFLDLFELATEAEPGDAKLKLTDIIRIIKQQTGYEYSNKALNYLGRWLTSEARAGRVRRTMSNGSPHYCLHPLNKDTFRK